MVCPLFLLFGYFETVIKSGRSVDLTPGLKSDARNDDSEWRTNKQKPSTHIEKQLKIGQIESLVTSFAP